MRKEGGGHFPDPFFQMNSSSIYPPCFLSFNSFNFLLKDLLLFCLCVCMCICVCTCTRVYLCLWRPEVGVGPHDGAAGTLTFLLHISKNSISETYPYTSDFLIWLSSPFTNNFHFHFLPLISIIAIIPSVILSIAIKDDYFFCNSILYVWCCFLNTICLTANNYFQVSQLIYSIYFIGFVGLFY